MSAFKFFGNASKLVGTISFDDAAHETDGVQKIKPFGQRKFGRLAGELLQRFIRPEQHGQFAELRGFLEKAQVART